MKKLLIHIQPTPMSQITPKGPQLSWHTREDNKGSLLIAGRNRQESEDSVFYSNASSDSSDGEDEDSNLLEYR